MIMNGPMAMAPSLVWRPHSLIAWRNLRWDCDYVSDSRSPPVLGDSAHVPIRPTLDESGRGERRQALEMIVAQGYPDWARSPRKLETSRWNRSG